MVSNIATILKQNGVQGATAPTIQTQANPLQSASTAPQDAAGILLEGIQSITVTAIVHKAKMTLVVTGLDPAGIVDGIKQLDPAAEFDTSFAKGGFGGGKRGDKKAAVTLILIEKFGTKIIATTPEGETLTVGWRDKDKLAEALKALPLSEVERAQANGAIEGKLSIATLALAGKGVEVEYYKSDWNGKEELRATGLTAPTAPAGGAQ